MEDMQNSAQLRDDEKGIAVAHQVIEWLDHIDLTGRSPFPHQQVVNQLSEAAYAEGAADSFVKTKEEILAEYHNLMAHHPAEPAAIVHADQTVQHPAYHPEMIHAPIAAPSVLHLFAAIETELVRMRSSKLEAYQQKIIDQACAYVTSAQMWVDYANRI